jgi:hypothetical protein
MAENLMKNCANKLSKTSLLLAMLRVMQALGSTQGTI